MATVAPWISPGFVRRLLRPKLGQMSTAHTRPRHWYLREVLVIAAGAVAALVSIIAYNSGLLGSVELHTVDARFDIRGTQRPPHDLVVVQIDDATFNDLGVQWPFPRSLHARVIRRISADRPAVIAYDVQFTEATTPKEDNALINAVGQADGRVVLAASAVDARGRTNVLGGDAVLRRVHARVGNTAFPPDSDGVLRRVPYSVEGLTSFAVVAAEIASGGKVDRAAMGAERQWVDFYGPAGTVPAVSFSNVLKGKIKPGFFSGKVVVVGASSGSLQDLHPTATSRSQLMAGPEIEANAISTVLRRFPLRSSPGAVDLSLILLCAFLVPLANLRLRLTPAVAVGIAGAAGLLIGVPVAFNSGWVVTLVYPAAALALSSVGVLAACYAATVLKKRVAGPALLAAEAASAGEAALANREFERALDLFGRSQRLWQEAGVPYEAARARVQLAQSYRGLDDIESATMQLRAAQQAFEHLGAVSEERATFETLQTILAPDALAPGSEVVSRTFMFTDIVESTALVGAIGDQAWAHLHRWHDDTLRRLLAGHQGEEVQHTGDGFFVSFADAGRALACAIDIQRTLADHRRTHGFSPRVRIGLHTCAAMRRGKDGYEGMGIHTAARIGAYAQGDEILVSRETLELVERPPSLSGEQLLELKGIATPIEVAAVGWEAVSEPS
ncbi:MAG: adenylate cyclase [Gaiellaceae bacterium]|nr:adenylate cyclase [Gaiellaceae bacterium]